MIKILFILAGLFIASSCSHQKEAKRYPSSNSKEVKISDIYKEVSGSYQLENRCSIWDYIDAPVGTVFETRYAEYKEDNPEPSRVLGRNSSFLLVSEGYLLKTITSSIQEMEYLKIGKIDNYFIRTDKSNSTSYSIRLFYDRDKDHTIERNIIFTNDYLLWIERDHDFGMPQTCLFKKI